MKTEDKMPVAEHIKELMSSSSFIRKMFEEGIQMKARYGDDNVYDFSIGNPDLEPPEEVKNTVKKLSLLDEPGIHGYMPNAGYKFAREAMAEKTSAEQGVKVGFEHIVMGVGAAGAINSVMKAVLSPGDEVLVPAPYFPEYNHYVANHGGKIVPVPAKPDFSPDVEAMAAAANERTAALIINSPNNPSGKIYTEGDIRSIAGFLKAHKEKTGRTILLVVDEPYRSIVYGGKTVSPVFPFWPDSVVVTSFAKNLSLPGERIGYTAVNPAASDCGELVDAVVFATRVLGYVNAPAFFQRVVAESWDAPVDYSLYARRREALSDILKAAGIPYSEPEGAFYLFCRVPEPRKKENLSSAGNDKAFCDHLKKYRILAVPGSGFCGPGWIRLAYCVSPRTISGSAGAFKEAVENW